MLFDYFKVFGALSDHIVRHKIANSHGEDQTENIEEIASFTIHFRSLDKEEHELLGQLHSVGGVEVHCSKQGVEGTVADRKIFIKYLDKKATADDIRESMSRYGEVESVHISMKKDKSMNLGLGNVLFKNREAVEKVLNDPSVIIRSKKVKVEQFKCSSSGSKTPCAYSSSCLKLRSPQQHQNWTEPILESHSGRHSNFSPYWNPTMKSKTAISVREMQSLHDSDQEMDKFMFRAAKSPLLSGYSKPTTCRDAKDSVLLDLSTKNGDYNGPSIDFIKSLDFSLIEEECEDSPRQRRGSEKFHLSPRAPYDEEKERSQKCPIIYVHGGRDELQSANNHQKGSFHSVKPTSKTYYKNPRHHMVPITKNHRVANLRLNRRFRIVEGVPLPGALLTNMINVPRFRLF
jgi:RNA recognition motif-containing protein